MQTADLALTPRYQQKREAVLQQAALLFNRHGLKATTLASIADSVGLATNSVTYYYRKKEDLALACMLRAIEAFDAVTERAAEQARVADRVRAFFQGHAELLADIALGRHPPLMQFHEIRALPEPQAAQAFTAYTAMFRRVRSLLKGAQPGPSAVQGTGLNAQAHLLLAIATWMGSWLDERYEPEDYTRIAARVSDLLVAGTGGACQALPGVAAWRPAPGADAMAEAFLRTATALLNEQGYRGASVDKIAARMQRSKGAFYHHNDNKLDLVSACFERTATVMRQTLGTAQAVPGPGRDRAFSAALALVLFQISSDGPLLRVAALSAMPDPVRRQRAHGTLSRLTERMTALLVDGMVDASMRPLDPGIMAQVIAAAIYAAAGLGRWAPGIEAGNVAAFYVRPLFEGLRCDPG